MATVLAAFFVQLGSHFIPWAAIFGKRKLPHLVAYVIGTLTIGAIFTIWALSHGENNALLMYWLIVTASGAGVTVGYGIDLWIRTHARSHEAEQREKMLMEMRDDEQIERLR